jgi:hypothetical protein
MAPEQLHGAAHVDHRADLYGVAAVLFHMLAGRRPVIASTLAELARKLLLETPPPLEQVAPAVGPEVSAAVMRGLARDLAERWPDALGFEQALRACLQERAGSTDVEIRLPEARADQARTLVSVPPSLPATGEGASSWPSAEAPPLPTSPAWDSGLLSSPGPQPLSPPQPAQPAFTPPVPPPSPESTQGLRAALSTRRFPLWVLLVLIGVTAVFTAAVAVAVVVGVGVLDERRGGGGGGGLVEAFGLGQRITPGQSVAGTLQMGRTLDYALRVDRAGLVQVSLVGDFDCYLRILRDGAVMFEDDDGGGELNSALAVTLVPGDYVVQVASFQNSGGGSFVLRVQ